MKQIARLLVLAGLVGICVVAWCKRDDRQIIAAQRRTPVTVTRLFTGSDGQTHAEEMDIKLKPHARLDRYEISQVIQVTKLEFARRSPGFVRDWHASTERTYGITLSGRAEIEVAGGRKISLEPGRVVLLEDMKSKGHIARTVGTEDWVVVLVQVADQ